MSAPLFEFGPFVLDPAKRQLLRHGVPQTLTPKAFDVLLLLVEQRGRVVSKEELLSSLWPNTFVEEGNLTQQIFVLRKLLNGDSMTPELVATITRRGYRFVGEVVERYESPEIVEKGANLPSRRSLRPSLFWANRCGPLHRASSRRPPVFEDRPGSTENHPGDGLPRARTIPQHLARLQLCGLLLDGPGSTECSRHMDQGRRRRCAAAPD